MTAQIPRHCNAAPVVAATAPCEWCAIAGSREAPPQLPGTKATPNHILAFLFFSFFAVSFFCQLVAFSCVRQQSKVKTRLGADVCQLFLHVRLANSRPLQNFIVGGNYFGLLRWRAEKEGEALGGSTSRAAGI